MIEKDTVMDTSVFNLSEHLSCTRPLKQLTLNEYFSESLRKCHFSFKVLSKFILVDFSTLPTNVKINPSNKIYLDVDQDEDLMKLLQLSAKLKVVLLFSSLKRESK